MQSIFGTPWEDLGREHVDSFLKGAGDETLFWEVKSSAAPPTPEAVRKAVGGFANSRGGFLILGAEGSAKTGRSLVGVTFPDEPRVWLDSVIRDGISPVPEFDVHAWDIDDGGAAAVVMVEPAALPPCITLEGALYVRVSGRTVPVTDPAELARLFRRGEVARRAAEHLARRAARRLVSDRPMTGKEGMWFAVGLAATGRPDDIGRLLFVESTKDKIAKTVHERLLPGRYSRAPYVYVDVRQDSLRGQTLAERQPLGDQERAWIVSVSWDGAAAVVGSVAESAHGIEDLFLHLIRPAVAAAADLLAVVGSRGPTHLVLEISGGVTLLPGIGAARELKSTVIQRWLNEPGMDNQLAESLKREVMRAAGFEAWEEE